MNGSERTAVPEVQQRGDSLVFLFPEYQSAMAGIWDGRRWRGQLLRYRADTTANEFTASPVPEKDGNAPASGAPTRSLAGTYRVLAQSAGGIDTTMTATFRMQGDSIVGTIIAPDGDYGLLAGVQSGDHVQLTRFTGWQAFLLELDRDGPAWRAALYARSGDPQAFRLEPRPRENTVPIAGRTTTAKDPRARFNFQGLSSTGELIRSTDDRYKGKAVIVDIMGTWCHNCMDAAPVLEQLSRKYKNRGLEVVALSFELKDDPALGRKNLARYAARYDIKFPLLYCGSTGSRAVDSILRSQLNDFYAYPTTLFLDARGRIHSIHVGFRGPGTGDEYQRQVQDYDAEVERILPR